MHYQLPNRNGHWNPPHNNQWRHYTPRGRQQFTGRLNFNRPHVESDQYNTNYYCETCDRGFKNQQELEKHKTQHQKCNIDGCQFIAHPKVITKHIQMQHSTGLYKRIATTDNPEDIKKWIEERKKRFPTKKNIELKAAERKEKMERGEKMGLNQRKDVKRNEDFQKKRKNKFDHDANKRQRQMRQGPLLINKNANARNKPQKELPNVEDYRTLKPFTGIQNILEEADVEDENNEKCSFIIEDESDNEPENLPEKSEPSVCEALTSLISNYESSDDDVSDKLDIKNHTSKLVNDLDTNQSFPKTEQSIIIKNNTDNDSGPDEAQVTKQKENYESKNKVNISKTHIPKELKNCKQKKQSFKTTRNKLPSTLLEKLLFREIKQERNIILQCVRHIVKKKYFE